MHYSFSFTYFFFHHPPPTEIYTLSLHDALPDLKPSGRRIAVLGGMKELGTESEAFHAALAEPVEGACVDYAILRSEEHTSELQSQFHLVCRLLLEKKKKKSNNVLLK